MCKLVYYRTQSLITVNRFNYQNYYLICLICYENLFKLSNFVFFITPNFI